MTDIKIHEELSITIIRDKKTGCSYNKINYMKLLKSFFGNIHSAPQGKLHMVSIEW